MIVDEDISFEKSTDVINLLVDDFIIYMETTGVYASRMNRKTKDTTEAFTTWL